MTQGLIAPDRVEAMDEQLADFFISRAGADKAFAIWVATLIRLQGKRVILQDESFGHQNFMGAMHRALESGARVVALVSPDYLKSDHCIAEACGALKGDPLNRLQRLIPFRLHACAPDGMLAQIPSINLTPERRSGDATALAVTIAQALGFDNPVLDGLGPPPEGTLPRAIPIRHPDIRPNSAFVGREPTLAALGERLRNGVAALTNSDYVAHAVNGMGGVGKTALAREYAWRNRDAYDGVWWIAAETEEGVLQGLVELGDHLIAGLKQEKDRAAAALKTLRWLEHAGAARPFLLVYDNVEDLALFDRWRPAAGAHVLLTTRLTTLHGVAKDPFTVDLFEPETAVRLLCESAGRDEPEAAARLAEALGYLPLAIAQAAAYCGENRLIDFDAYAVHVAALLDRAPTARTADAYPASVFATFTLAIDRVVQGDAARGLPPCPEAEALMRRAAFLAPDAIPLDLFDDIAPELRLKEIIGQLERVSLLRTGPLEDGSPAVGIHRLVQTVMCARLEADNSDKEEISETLAHLAEKFPRDPDDVREWPRCAALHTHASTALAAALEIGDNSDATSLLSSQLGLYLLSRADYATAELRLRSAVEIDRKSYGEEHPTVAAGFNNLASVLQLMKRTTEAETLLRRALEISLMNYGYEDSRVATNLNNLAQLLQDTGLTDEADSLMRYSLEICQNCLGEGHPEVAISLNNLATLLQDKKQYSEAEPLLRQAIEIDQKHYGEEHPSVARDLNNLALLLSDTGRIDEAKRLMERAVAICEASLGREHPNTRTVAKNLAAL